MDVGVGVAVNDIGEGVIETISDCEIVGVVLGVRVVKNEDDVGLADIVVVAGTVTNTAGAGLLDNRELVRVISFGTGVAEDEEGLIEIVVGCEIVGSGLGVGLLENKEATGLVDVVDDAGIVTYKEVIGGAESGEGARLVDVVVDGGIVKNETGAGLLVNKEVVGVVESVEGVRLFEIEEGTLLLSNKEDVGTAEDDGVLVDAVFADNMIGLDASFVTSTGCEIWVIRGLVCFAD